jgi:putative heme degradation protein
MTDIPHACPECVYTELDELHTDIEEAVKTLQVFDTCGTPIDFAPLIKVFETTRNALEKYGAVVEKYLPEEDQEDEPQEVASTDELIQNIAEQLKEGLVDLTPGSYNISVVIEEHS